MCTLNINKSTSDFVIKVNLFPDFQNAPIKKTKPTTVNEESLN